MSNVIENNPVDFAPFCEGKNCPEFIRWEWSDFGQTMQCESCKLAGQSQYLTEYPPDCLHLTEIKEYESLYPQPKQPTP